MFSTNPAQGNQARTSSDPTRYGCFAAKIGFLIQHRLEQNLTLPSGRLMKAGQKIHLSVQDITRNVDIERHVKWVCSHPSCAGRKWDSKKALINEHPQTKDLVAALEIHRFHGVAHLPGVEAHEEKRAKDGSIIQEATDAKLPTIMLVSDEE